MFIKKDKVKETNNNRMTNKCQRDDNHRPNLLISPSVQRETENKGTGVGWILKSSYHQVGRSSYVSSMIQWKDDLEDLLRNCYAEEMMEQTIAQSLFHEDIPHWSIEYFPHHTRRLHGEYDPPIMINLSYTPHSYNEIITIIKEADKFKAHIVITVKHPDR